MYYKEMLRVFGGLKWVAGVLLALYALVVIIAGANGAFSEMRHAHAETDGVPLPALFGLAGFVAAIFAITLSRALSDENESHLPVAWTLPYSRMQYAATIAAVDALGILIAFALTIGVSFLFIGTFGAFPLVQVTPDSGIELLRYLLFPLAYYGLLTALSASASRAGRALCGWGAAGSFTLSGITAIPFPKPWDAIVAGINYINPLRYAGYSHRSAGDTVNIMGPPDVMHTVVLSVGVDCAALAVLCGAGLIAGICNGAAWRLDMYYVEFLRASRSVTIATIVICVLLVINYVAVSTAHIKGGLPSQVDVSILFAMAGITASIMASILGGSLACENDGHLPVAWTKPASRARHALVKMLVDVSAIFAVFAIMLAAAYAEFAALGFAKVLTVSPGSWGELVRYLVAPLAIYGLMQGLTASLSRRAGMVIGFTWAAMVVLIILDTSPLPKPYHALFHFIDYANPMIYMSFGTDSAGVSIVPEFAAATAALIAIAVAGSGAALVQWHRLEA